MIVVMFMENYDKELLEKEDMKNFRIAIVRFWLKIRKIGVNGNLF